MIITFLGSCVNLDGELIYDMVDKSEDLDYEDFIKIIPERELASVFPQYDWENKGDLKLKDDWAVGYCKSQYDGLNCVYVEHSSIEYVWWIAK